MQYILTICIKMHHTYYWVDRFIGYKVLKGNSQSEYQTNSLFELMINDKDLIIKSTTL